MPLPVPVPADRSEGQASASAPTVPLATAPLATAPLATAFLAAATLALAACGTPTPTRAPPRVAAGQVLYEARLPTERGLGPVEQRPAVGVRVELLDDGGATIATTETSAEGRFDVDAVHASKARVWAVVPGHDLAVTHDPNGQAPHAFVTALSASPSTLVLRDADGLGGAFHALDTVRRGLERAHAWTDADLPPTFVYWALGGDQPGSDYLEERPAGSGRYGIELLGGAAGALDTTDHDEHDEGIVLHELGHLVFERLTFDSSIGGAHPRGARVEPGLAWEEGRATWFALCVLGAPIYRDSIGVAPHGSLLHDEDAETMVDDVPGPGSERAVITTLWDLADGAEGLADRDGDGVAMGCGPMLRAMIAHADEPESYPSLESFLRHLVDAGHVTREEVVAVLSRHQQPASLLDGPLAWPRVLTLDAPASGTIDGLTQPAPSGGDNVPSTGLDASHTYLVRVDRAGDLSVTLDIDGTGLAEDHTDLDLELRTRRSRVLDGSYGYVAREAVAHPVEPGVYVIKVRDGGDGNRARYTLRAHLR